MNISVVFTAFARPPYLLRTLRSWQRVRGIERTPVRFQVEPGHPQVEDLCRQFPSELSVVEVNPQRLGVQVNPRTALDSVFTGTTADFVILAEDDIVVSPAVLDYFHFAARHFRLRPDVAAVSAFQMLAPPEAQLGGVLVDDFFPGQVWGTWRDRWNELLYPTWDLSGWDLFIHRRLVKERGYRVVMPHFAHSQHIGAFGVNMTPAMLEPGQSKCFISDMPSVVYKVTADDPGARFPSARSQRDASLSRP